MAALISKLRHRIVFKSQQSVPDGAGGRVTTLVDYYTCWAEIDNRGNNKTNILSKDSIDDSTVFRIRWAQSLVIDNQLVIVYNNQKYLINSVINENDDYKFYLIGCSTIS
jgi:SPP1 family predicted phage head-tail adaptor